MSPHRCTPLTAIITIFALSAFPAWGAEPIYVPSLEYPTIQSGIDGAYEGQFVVVNPGTYEEMIFFDDKNVILKSLEGPDVTVIDGGRRGQCVTFYLGDPDSAVIDGFTIRNGLASAQGMPFPCPDTGGGIGCYESSPRITNCLITENKVSGMGGGIFCSSGSAPTITDCTIRDNTAQDSFDPMFGYNWYGEGGGIYCEENSSPLIMDCVITGNNAGDDSTLCLFGCHGGGVCCSENSSPSIVNCFITGNNAGVDDHMSSGLGGGIYSEGSFPEVTNCTISENFAESSGGSIHGEGTYTNCILWGNSSEIHGSPSVTYSDVLGGWPGTGNIDSNPLFVGGADYHLMAGSPCIDAGTDAGVYTDFDGDPRPNLSGFDMGADEHVGPCGDVDGDGYEDAACGGDDCNDSDPTIHPGMPELCDMIDNNCNGVVDEDCLPCSSVIAPTSRTPIAFFLVPVMAFVFLGRSLFG